MVLSFRVGVLLLGACLSVTAADPVVIDLGGPRKVRGEVATTADRYAVSVSFLAVRVFDAATNDEVNRELGREYAVRVLARHLSAGPDVVFETGGDEVREAKADGERFRVVVAWPRTRVRVAGKSEPATVQKVSPAGFTDKFFTAKQDHLDTLAAVARGNATAIRAAREQAAATAEDDRRRVLARAVTRVEDRGVAAFDALAGAVKKEANLLDTTERPEVLAAIGAARKQFEADLKAALNDPLPSVVPAFKDVEIVKPYDAFLTANPLLMDVAGAVIVEAGAGEFHLIGVAKTVLKDGSPEDVLRAERVTMLKALAAAIGERDGAKITYLKRVEDRITVVDDGTGEKATSVSERLKVTQETITGFAKDLPVVGRWRSADGKVFYLAVGGKLPGKK